MKILKHLGLFLITVILVFAAFIGYSTLNWYDPPQELVLAQNQMPDVICEDSTMSVLSWNIGYAGLGRNMDFFYDGGERVRDSYQQTVNNLDSIRKFLKQQTSQTFILIQEIDLHSKRSYFLNEMDSILKQMDFYPTFAPNYVTKFVPIPVTSPMGQVNSGVMILSKYLSETSTRYGYPGTFSWPNRLFNLRRCMLVSRFPTYNGNELVLINTHNSAYDKGELKTQEMQYLKGFVLAEYAKGNYVVVGGDWNQSPPNLPLNKFGENYQVDFFKLTNIDPGFLPGDWKWVFDPETPTNRYLNEAYIAGKTCSCVLDFFLVSPNVEIVHNETVQLNFSFSDHNPIKMRFRLN